MTFVVNYNEGYEVGVLLTDYNGYVRQHPLRNFGQRQGDAFIFKMHDCPRLTYEQVMALVRRFDRNVKYKRVNGRWFVRQE